MWGLDFFKKYDIITPEKRKRVIGMKKFMLSVLVGILGFLGLTVGVNADSAPSNFVTGAVVKLPEYLPGLVSYYKPLANGIEVFCEDAGLTYWTGVTYDLKGTVEDGYIYIFEHRPNTGNVMADYYAQSIAMWWYKDYLTKTNTNLTSEQKDYIYNHRNDNIACKIIYELVEGAIKYKQVAGKMEFSNNNVNFTENNGYLVSDVITLKTEGITNGGTLKLNNAPKGATIINSTLDSKTGNGTFQIRIPVSSVKEGEKISFTINASAKYTIKKMFDYYVKNKPISTKNYQQVVYGVVYSGTSTVNAEKTVTYTKSVKKYNKLTINKVDENGKALKGASLSIYSGDCTKTTCTNAIKSWVTDGSAKVYSNIPVGTYTLEETKAPEGYLLAEKILINVDSDSKEYTITMKDVKAQNKLTINKVDENGKALKGASLSIYNGDCTKTTCTNAVKSWVTDGSARVFTNIPVGTYTLVETSAPEGYKLADKILINIDSNNKSYTYTMVDQKNLSIRISKTDLTGQNEIPGATLVLKDSNGSVIETWVSKDIPHYVVLDAGEYYLTETVAPNGYILSTDTINFKVGLNNRLYEKKDNIWVQTDYIKMVNEKETKEFKVRISKTDITGDKEVPGASLILQDESKVQVASWVSSTEPHYETLKPGIYTLTETIAPKGFIISKSSITFKVDNDGNIYEKNSANEWIKVSYIKMVNLSKSAININKLDSETNEYVVGATLRVKNDKGEIIATWVSTNESYYLSLEEGSYILEEVSAPKGYINNNKPVYFKVDADNNVYIANDKGEYVLANGVIMYNEPEKIDIPATGLSSTLTYAIGSLILSLGAVILYRNEKKC